MATERFDTFVFEKGQFIPYLQPDQDQMQWGANLAEQGFAAEDQLWGRYPDAYVKVYEARAGAAGAFKFVAVLNLVCFPHHVYVRDLNDLVQLLTLVVPLLSPVPRSEHDRGDALYGTQGADDQSEDRDAGVG